MRRHVVTRARGAGWDPGRPVRDQAGWERHAAFMDTLTSERFVALGGPADNGSKFVLVVDALDEQAIRTRLALDPWEAADLLRTFSVQPWTILLGDDERIGAQRQVQLVTMAAGPRWHTTRPRTRQAGWELHAAFMDELVEQRQVLLGGPLDERHALLVMSLDDESAVRARLAADPWADGTLTIEHIEPWDLWLQATPHTR
jgi:uncharacterized protein YciI